MHHVSVKVYLDHIHTKKKCDHKYKERNYRNGGGIHALIVVRNEKRNTRKKEQGKGKYDIYSFMAKSARISVSVRYN